MLLSWIDTQAETFSGLLHVPIDQIKLIGCLLASFPVGFIFKQIKNPFLRHFISFTLGIFFQILLFREKMLHGAIFTFFTYFTLKFFGRKMAVFIFMACMLYLSIFNIYRMTVQWGGWKIDVSIVLMIFVCRCTSFAWCYKDGGADEKNLTPEQMKKRIVNLPSFFNFVSFMYFYGGSIVGPSYDYHDHEDFIYHRGDYKTKPATFFVSSAYLLFSVIPMLGVVFLSKKWAFLKMIEPEFAEQDYLNKILFFTIAMQVHRFKYYSAWFLANANITAAGLNYNPNGKTITEKYGKIVTIRPLDYELKDNIKDKLEAWNTPSQIWLKNYVYLRILSETKIQSTTASNITFMVSSIWHGFYPGYYLAFTFGFLAQSINKSLFKIRSRFSWIPEPFGYLIRWLLTGFALSYVGATFALLDLSKAWTFFKAWDFIPVGMLLFLFVTLTFTSLGKPPRTKESKGKKNGVTERKEGKEQKEE